jgi:ribosomal protein S18 acetylase RimI-like enzyme
MEFKIGSELAFDVRPQMGEIFADGFFELGLKFICKDKAKLARGLNHIFDLKQFHFALDGEEVMAFTACCTGKPPLLPFDKKIMVSALGFFRGRFAHAMLSRVMLNHTYPFEIPQNTGTIEFVATVSAHRGKGIGYDLLNHVMEVTPFDEYILEVADTNTSAVRLYEKLGYKEYTRKPAPKRSGFNHFLYMKKSAR